MATSKYGFTFNGHHSSEFGLTVLNTKAMTLPSKNKVTVQLPYAQGVIDLSDIYGNNSYGERSITFNCKIPVGYNDSNVLYEMWTEVMRWLMEPKTKTVLKDDTMPEYYYLGEVQTAPTLAESSVFSTFSIVFQCFPFRFHPNEYNEVWDTFDLTNGVMQPTEYEIQGSETITLINVGEAPINLICNASSDFELNIDGVICAIEAGMTDNMDVQLQPGVNNIKITGTGTLTFDWTEEVI